MNARAGALLGLYSLILLAIFGLRPAPTPGPMLRDFEAYWSAGTAWDAHADPYSRAVWTAEQTVPGVDATRNELLPFVGPPVALPLWGALARLPYVVAARFWYAVLAVALLALVLAALRGAGSPLGVPKVSTGIAFAVGFGPLTSDLALGQVALLAILGATCVALPDVKMAAQAPAAFLASLQPNVALGVVTRIGRNRATLALALGAFAAYLAGAWGAGPLWPIRYAATLIEHAKAERFSAIQLTPAAIAHGFGANDGIASTLAILAAAGAVAAAIAICVRVRDPFARFAACSALVPFVATFFHEHDLIAAFPAAVLCAVRAQGSARAPALFAALLIAVDWLGLAQRPTGIVQSLVLATVACGAFVLLGNNRTARGLATVAIGGGALFICAAWLAAHHQAPVWPDTLAPFASSPADGAAAIWAKEQTASGLLAVVPTWSVLRTLSLFGCALLAYISTFIMSSKAVQAPG